MFLLRACIFWYAFGTWNSATACCDCRSFWKLKLRFSSNTYSFSCGTRTWNPTIACCDFLSFCRLQWDDIYVLVCFQDQRLNHLLWFRIILDIGIIAFFRQCMYCLVWLKCRKLNAHLLRFQFWKSILFFFFYGTYCIAAVCLKDLKLDGGLLRFKVTLGIVFCVDNLYS